MAAIGPNGLGARPRLEEGDHPLLRLLGRAVGVVIHQVQREDRVGGHARVGFENNLMLPGGELAPSNADLVGIVTQALRPMALATETAEGLREHIAATAR